MKIALCGLPFSGKSTVFKALVGKKTQAKASAAGKIQLHIGNLEVEDKCLETLARILNSEKITYPRIDLVDLNVTGERVPKGIETSHLREFDALILIIGIFASEDPIADLNSIESELILADMQVVQHRIEKINKERKAKPKKEEDPELLLLQRLARMLEEENVLKDLKLGQEELKMLAGFQLFTP